MQVKLISKHWESNEGFLQRTEEGRWSFWRKYDFGTWHIRNLDKFETTFVESVYQAVKTEATLIKE